jgi:hypothetical protein
MRRLVLVVAVGVACTPGKSGPATQQSVSAADRARVLVEVLNTTSRPGLARAATRQLRDAGLDVIFFGGSDTPVDSTLILVRRGQVDRGKRVAKALGGGRVELRPDSLRRVDVSVLLGKDWKPPITPRP